MQSVTSPRRSNHHDDTMSVISTDVELSATEIAELHQDIANGHMDLATSQTAATVTSAGSSAINQINQWPKKPTALSGDEGLRAVEHTCGHQLYELLHQFLSNHQFLLQAVETNFSFTDFIAEVHSKATRATIKIESIQSDIAIVKSTMKSDLPQQGSARDRAVLTSKFQRFADSDDNNETYLQAYFDAMRATAPFVESPHFGVPLTPHGSLTLDVLNDLATLQAEINAAEKNYSERQRYRDLLERKHRLVWGHYEAIYSLGSDLPIMELLRGRPIPYPRSVGLKSESRKWNKQLTELIKQKNAYLLAGQIAETTLTTYANLGTKISTMTQHVPSIRTNLNYSIKIRLTGTTMQTRHTICGHVPHMPHVYMPHHVVCFLYTIRNEPLVFGGCDDIRVHTYSDSSYGTGRDGRSISGHFTRRGPKSGAICGRSHLSRYTRLSVFSSELESLTGAVKSTMRFQYILHALQMQPDVPLQYADNKAMIDFVKSNAEAKGVRHPEIKMYFVREKFQMSLFDLQHIYGRRDYPSRLSH
jgi:hypothetical protein